MNNYTHKEGSFSLFENTKKDKPNQPDMRGEGTLNGKPHEIAAWRKNSERAGEFLSISIQEKRAVVPGSIPYEGRKDAAKPPMQAKELPLDKPEEDDVPF